MEVRRALIPIVSLAVLAGVSCSGSDGSDAPSPAAASQVQEEAGETPGSDDTSTPAVDGPNVVASGRFERIGYKGSGTAELVDTGGGSQVRFSEFDVETGPALRVYLSAARAGSPEERYIEDFVDLGKLRSFDGNQTYDVPAGTSKAVTRSVVIWCAEFDVGFIVAPLDRI